MCKLLFCNIETFTYMVVIFWCAQIWPKVTKSSWFCEFSNVVALGHNKLWRSLAENRFSVTSQMLWPLATANCSGLQPRKLDLE